MLEGNLLGRGKSRLHRRQVLLLGLKRLQGSPPTAVLNGSQHTVFPAARHFPRVSPCTPCAKTRHPCTGHEGCADPDFTDKGTET